MRTDASRFERERRLVGQLGAEHGFVPLLDSGTVSGEPYLVMPFLPGGTLRERLDREGTLGVEKTLALGRRLADAMGRAHELGIVHRDLKPENILFDAQGVAWIADLGLAKHFARDVPGAEVSVALSRTGEMKGTLGYMPPEQMRSTKDAGASADVFALGAILYECLAGEPAFAAESVVALVDRIESGVVTPLRSKAPACPRWLAAAIESALASDPARRPPDGAALARLLEGSTRVPLGGAFVLAGLGVAAVAAGLVLQKRGPGTVGEPASAPSTERAAVLSSAPSAPPPPPPPSSTEPARSTWVHGGALSGLVFAAGGSRAVSCSEDGTLRVWDSRSGRPIETTNLREPIRALAARGGRVFVATPSAVVVRDVARGETEKLLSVPDGLALAVLSDGRLVVGAPNTIHVVDVDTGRDIDRESNKHATRVRGLAVASRAPVFASGGFGWGLKIWYFDEKGRIKVRHLLQVTGVTSLPVIAMNELGTRALTPDDDRLIQIWDAANGAHAGTLAGHKAFVKSVVFEPGGRAISGDASGVVKVWDVAGLREVASIDAHKAAVVAIAVSPDGKTVLTAGEDGVIRAWELGEQPPLVPRREG